MGEDRMERGGKRCYYEVLVKFFYWAGEKLNEIDLSVGMNILFLFKFVNPIDPVNLPFLTLPTCLPPLCCCCCCSSGRKEGKFFELAWAKNERKCFNGGDTLA